MLLGLVSGTLFVFLKSLSRCLETTCCNYASPFVPILFLTFSPAAVKLRLELAFERLLVWFVCTGIIFLDFAKEISPIEFSLVLFLRGIFKFMPDIKLSDASATPIVGNVSPI